MNYQNKRSQGSGFKGGNHRKGGFSQKNDGFKSTCAECGSNCTVPFKPNGKKPVLCSDCFRGEQRGRGNRNERKPFKRSFGKPGFDRKPKNDGVEKELKRMNNKLDQILRILQEVTVEEIDE